MARTAVKQAVPKRTQQKAPSAKEARRSYGLNEPDNFVVEEWPQTKRDLYESARTLFWEKGFAETSVQEIVEGARLTKGAFYHYFDSKEDLLSVIYERSLARLMRIMHATVTDDMPAADAISAFVEEMVKIVIDYRVEVALFWEEYRKVRPEGMPDNSERRRRFMRMVVAIIERGVKRGELSGVKNPTVAAMALIGMCQFTHHWYRPGGKMSPAEVGRSFADLFLQGIASKKKR